MVQINVRFYILYIYFLIYINIYEKINIYKLMEINREIYLIRHGETEWNKLGLRQGSRNDIPLNKEGKKQAILTGKYLADYRINDKNFDQVLCSPLVRASETAKIICKKIKYNIDDIKYFDELVENDSGLLSIGKTIDELQKDKFYNDFFKFRKQLKKKVDPIEYIEFANAGMKKLEKKYELEYEENIIERCKKIITFI